MKLSIVIPVLNSHEIVRRQLLHMAGIGIPNDVEVILVDDGSSPPIAIAMEADLPFTAYVVRTGDNRDWTWALARNTGARMARGEYLYMFDLDHFFSEDALATAREFTGDKIQFIREFGILDEDGDLDQREETLMAHGIDPQWIEHSLIVKPLPNNFVMRKSLFWELGGYREDRVGNPYPQGEDADFKHKWTEYVRDGKCTVSTYRPTMYVWPNGQFCGDVDYNPFGLFHDLSRKSNRNLIHRRLERAK